LADLGFGYPDLGSFSLSELQSVSLPFGMAIERDLLFVGGCLFRLMPRLPGQL